MTLVHPTVGGRQGRTILSLIYMGREWPETARGCQFSVGPEGRLSNPEESFGPRGHLFWFVLEQVAEANR